METVLRRLVNKWRPKIQILLVRGRWCSVDRIQPTVYRVSVLDTRGKYVGARFITPLFRFNEEVDSAVHSLLLTHATY